MTKQIEVITSVERRRRWSREEKERLVAATLEPFAQRSHVGQLPCFVCDVQLIGQFALAAALMREGEEFNHGAAGLTLRPAIHEHVESSSIRLAGKSWSR